MNESNNASFVRIFDDIIFNNTDYNNIYLLDLLKIVFLDKNDNTESISDKLNDILKYLLSKDDNDKQYSFIEGLLSNEKIKELVSDEILKFEFEEILQFKSSIRRLAYDYFIENNKLFELDNFVLIDMIKVDEEKYKNELIKVIKSHIPDKSKTIKGIELLNNLSTLTEKDKSFFKDELSTHKDDNELKEEVLKCIETLK